MMNKIDWLEDMTEEDEAALDRLITEYDDDDLITALAELFEGLN